MRTLLLVFLYLSLETLGVFWLGYSLDLYSRQKHNHGLAILGSLAIAFGVFIGVLAHIACVETLIH